MVETWLNEELHPYYRKALCCEAVLVDEQTDYQHLQVVQTKYFGKTLLLDGIFQLTERDNAGYHEMIAHVPLLTQARPESVLIVGGGDGGSLQQVLRYPSVQHAVVCELDRRVVEVCAEHFPDFGHPFEDPRAELVVQDAFQYLENSERRFDVIISDTTDPIGMAERLFSPEFYHLMARALRPQGVIVTQCEQMFFDAALIADIYTLAKSLAKNPAYYHTLVPTYPGGGIGFMYISDLAWTEGLTRPYPPGRMHYLNPDVHRAAFALPEFFRRQLGLSSAAPH